MKNAFLFRLTRTVCVQATRVGNNADEKVENCDQSEIIEHP